MVYPGQTSALSRGRVGSRSITESEDFGIRLIKNIDPLFYSIPPLIPPSGED